MSPVVLTFAISTVRALDGIQFEFKMHDGVAAVQSFTDGRIILTIECPEHAEWEVRATVLTFDDDAEELFPDVV